jgi:hypothetical protein
MRESTAGGGWRVASGSPHGIGARTMGNIGIERREIEFEPLPEDPRREPEPRREQAQPEPAPASR